MQLVFEQGSSAEPRGHALLYFRDSSTRQLLASYVVVLPIEMDITKYIPPMLASQMEQVNLGEFSAFAVPPVPEVIPGHDHLLHLAAMRSDDVVQGGDVSSQDVMRTMQQVNEVVQEYARLYADYLAQTPATTTPEEGHGTASVEEVMYSLMSERDRLGELSRLAGTLRFAAERGDRELMSETETTVRALARYLPEGYKVGRIVETVKDTSERGARLARLYMDRCYKLCEGQYDSLEEVERAIRGLESEGSR
ncbi:MAG: hypothetical protein HYY00_06315 [Chloroflexi bacterium]|nr:hypothetical protein [Chloroflexota bacterium]